MKTRIQVKPLQLLLALVLTFWIGVFFRSVAGPFLGNYLGGLVNVNGTFYGPTNVFGTAQLNRMFAIQNDGLPTTNAFTVNIQASLDAINFTNVGTYNPSITNATNDSYLLSASPKIYLRVQAVTTNAINVGATYQ